MSVFAVARLVLGRLGRCQVGEVQKRIERVAPGEAWLKKLGESTAVQRAGRLVSEQYSATAE